MGNYHAVIVTRNCPCKTAFGEKANRILITRIRKSVSFVLARLFPYLTLFIDKLLTEKSFICKKNRVAGRNIQERRKWLKIDHLCILFTHGTHQMYFFFI
jgi:hypothetical protein